jgi:hypothetical protein
MHKVFLWNLDISLLWVEHRAGHAFRDMPSVHVHGVRQPALSQSLIGNIVRHQNTVVERLRAPGK